MELIITEYIRYSETEVVGIISCSEESHDENMLLYSIITIALHGTTQWRNSSDLYLNRIRF